MCTHTHAHAHAQTYMGTQGWGWREGMFGGKAWPGEKVKGGVSARGVLFLWVCVAHRVPALASAVTV